jgi:hypothetical protein
MPTQILCFRFLRGGSAWAGRQLQHGRVLPFAQLSQQDYLAIRKLERVMMNFALALVDLPKPGHLVRDLTFRVPKVDGVVLHLSLEGEFRTGKQAYGHVSLLDRREAASERVKLRGYQRLSHLSRSGCSEM